MKGSDPVILKLKVKIYIKRIRAEGSPFLDYRGKNHGLKDRSEELMHQHEELTQKLSLKNT